MPTTTQLPTDRAHQHVRLAVAEKIIADISTGIYRTPAAAVKELVSNAYDADATTVTINTGAPDFAEMVIRDDGDGMKLDRFLEVLQHIGGSWKRATHREGLSDKHKRPLIGRIGIGLLAIAQLGQRFYVSSSVKGEPTRFLAEINLEPFHKDDAALRKLTGGDPNKKVEIGSVRYVDGLPERRDSHFTVVTVPNPKQGLLSEMQSQLRNVLGAESVFDLTKRAPTFQQIVNEVQQSKRADLVLDGYHYFLWELGLLSPLSYLDRGPFGSRFRKIESVGTAQFWSPKSFRVIVDEYEIRRPIFFPNIAARSYGGPDPRLYAVEFDQDVAKQRLHVSGYVFAQQPHIDPVELQGVQIRIRGVGIGGYDRTWIGYPWDEGMKFGQVTGELYVHQGLESALNIDRASFRETDPHYLALRAWLWGFLHKTVFPAFKTRQDTYRKDVRKKEAAQAAKTLAKALESAPEPLGGSPHVAEEAAQDSGSQQ